MIHRLLRRELRDRRQHAEGVRRKKQHIPGMAAHAGNHSVRDELDRIGRARVLRVADVAVIGLAGPRIDHHVFEHRAEADGVINLRLFFF